MESRKDALDILARVLTYPGEEYLDDVARCRRLCDALPFGSDDARRSVVERIDTFSSSVNGLVIGELEELYTRTFDINPVSSLEVGWHLHGETYERGAFLVQMRDLLRRCAIEESNELPDHLTHALCAVGRMEEEEAAAFIVKCLVRALDKMLEGFAGKDNPYEHLLTATKLLLTDIRMQTAHHEAQSQ